VGITKLGGNRMLVKTKVFNEVEIDISSKVVFADGIPGFKDLKEYVLIKQDDETDFSYLQSLENEGICFIVVPPAILVGNYDIEISDDTVKKLNIEKPEDVELYTILTIPEDIRAMTANLKAPILINRKNNKAVQEILEDDKYSIKHRVIKEGDLLASTDKEKK
jgi:flagellar assembly factor FliW